MLRAEHIFVLCAIFFVQTQAWTYTSKVNRARLKEGSSCNVSSQAVGVCSFLRNCQTFVTKRVPYADLQRCSFVGNVELICCPQMATTIMMAPEPRVAFVERRPAKIACDRFTEKNPDRISSRVFGQELAFAGEFPHLGAILYTDTYSRYMVGCQASLISERFALTAASCVDTIAPTLVRFGVTEWNSRKKQSHQVDAWIKTATIHSSYRRGSPLHDIAIIEFTEDIPFSPFVSPACLQSDWKDYPSTVDLQVAGWMKFNTNSSKKVMNSYLLSANITTVELKTCIRTYKNYLQLKNFLGERNEGLYCAINFSRQFSGEKCYGDMGAALMVDTEELWEIIGIASYANPCGVRLPMVFTRISHYLDWIENRVWSPKSTSGKDSYIGL